MVVETEPTGPGAASPVEWTLDYARQAYENEGLPWPVSGDLTTTVGTAIKRQRGPFYLMRPPLRGVAGGWLQRRSAITRVQCEACPWSLAAHGTDWPERTEYVGKLAQRHTAATGHSLTITVMH